MRVGSRSIERQETIGQVEVLQSEASVPADSFIKLNTYNLFWIFVVTSVVGLVVETLVSYPADHMWKDRAGLVWGPFSPIYGAGTVLMTVFLNNMKDKNGFHLFVKAAIVGALFELFAGWTMKHLYGMVAWDYSSQPFNIGGYTCLEIACVWGMAGFLWMKLCLVPVVRVGQRIPRGTGRTVLTSLLAAFLAADIAMTFASCTFWFDRTAGDPVDTPVEQYFAQRYSDEFMAQKFQTISMYTDLAIR